MNPRGISTNIVLAIIGVVVILGAFVYTALNPQSQEVPVTEEAGGQQNTREVSQNSNTSAEVSTVPTKPVTQKPSTPPSSSSNSGTSSSVPTTAPEKPVTPESVTPAPSAAYDPGFQAATRITPEIPSENERATLPSCEGKTFTVDPVQLSIVTSITPTGSMNAGGVPEYAVVKVVGSGELNKYDIVAPGDVYITHITQEFGLSADPEDSTIYFALCKDVIGYVTHVKELSTPIYKMVTDSVCLGKPHVGENACLIKKLELIARGTLLGRVGRIEGSFGFGVIDLRTNRGLSNASAYAIKTNFAACPFAYLANASGFNGKITNSNSLCSAE